MIKSAKITLTLLPYPTHPRLHPCSKSPSSVYVNVCPTGSPMLDPSTNKPVPCTFGSNSCGSDHWCHLGLVPDEYQCCPGSPTNPGACQGLPEADGVLGAPAPPTARWYYDQAEMQCKQFTYNGRKGNQNNFLTKEDCEATCDGNLVLLVWFSA